MGEELTRVLEALHRGDGADASRLLPLVYEELRALAERRMARETPGQTLQATALVHEAWLRLVGPDGAGTSWDSRGHFFAAAAEAMRRILIDRARARGALKRGGDRKALTLDPSRLVLDDVPEGILDLDEALSALAREDPAKAELVKLRFFAGLTLDQAAAAMSISRATAARHWAYARAWLYEALS